MVQSSPKHASSPSKLTQNGDPCATIVISIIPLSLSPSPSRPVPLFPCPPACPYAHVVAWPYKRQKNGRKKCPLCLTAAHKIGLHSFVSRTMRGGTNGRKGCLPARESESDNNVPNSEGSKSCVNAFSRLSASGILTARSRNLWALSRSET